MISKNRIKLIKSLETRKYRLEHGLFVAEGHKLVGELLQTFQPVYMAALPEWIEDNRRLLPAECTIDVVTPEELQRASLQRTPQSVIALFPLPKHNLSYNCADENLCISLDGVQDPGNLGTIVRLADWFGITDIICSMDTADIYNPKAVQATMGALARVRVHYVHLTEFLSHVSVPIFGTFLDGEDIYSTELATKGIILMGNEGKGISSEVRSLVTHKLYIPNFPADRNTTESLNVAIATSITCAEFRRRQRNK